MNTAQRIDRYLKSKGSPLAGKGKAFVKSGKLYGIDPLLLVAISGAESQYGKELNGSFNAWGWGPGISFASYEQAIDRVAKGLRTGYFDKGLKTIAKIGAKWAPQGASNDPTGLNNNWVTNVTTLYDELGGAGFNGKGPSPAATAAPTPEAPAPDFSALGDFAMSNLTATATRQYNPPTAQLSSLAQIVAAARSAQPQQTQKPQQQTAKPATGASPGKWVIVPKPGGHSSPSPGKEILAAVADIARMFGKPLSVFDNTLHSKYTVNGRVSAHSAGRALDIAATGAKLRKVGYLALRYAGMGEKEARAAQKKGGLFNVGHYQIIFATRIGGNHWNHVHVGLRG